jgi:hypothetical protein
VDPGGAPVGRALMGRDVTCHLEHARGCVLPTDHPLRVPCSRARMGREPWPPPNTPEIGCFRDVLVVLITAFAAVGYIVALMIGWI